MTSLPPQTHLPKGIRTLASNHHLQTVSRIQWTLHGAQVRPSLGHQTLPKQTRTALFIRPVPWQTTMDPKMTGSAGPGRTTPQRLTNSISLAQETSASACRSDTKLAGAAVLLLPRFSPGAIDLAAPAMPHSEMTTRGALDPPYRAGHPNLRNSPNSASGLAAVHGRA